MLGLDALRAAAVLAVMMAHAGDLLDSQPAPGPRLHFLGESGVNAFFALSGFLVGGIALREIHHRRDVWRFWVRRWLRTLPAAVAVALLLTPVVRPGWVELITTLTFTRFLTEGLYGAFLPHFWSLAVEEWAYLLLPGLVLAVGRRDPLPWLALGWLGLAAARAGAIALGDIEPEAALHLSFLRLDAILGGVVAAAAAPRMPRSLRNQLAWAGATGIAVLHLVPPMLAAQGSLLPALFAATIPALAAWRPTGARWLWRLVLHVADISYGLYLVHLPLFVLVPQLISGPPLLMALVATWIAALALRRWIELPFIAMRVRQRATA
jgi:peptidoglycan/LPS O-acetylase OafA/YrhL